MFPKHQIKIELGKKGNNYVASMEIKFLETQKF